MQINAVTLEELARVNTFYPQYQDALGLYRLSQAHPSTHVAYHVGGQTLCGGYLTPGKVVEGKEGDRLCGRCGVWLNRHANEGALLADHWRTPASDYSIDGDRPTARLRRSHQRSGYYPYWGMDDYVYWKVGKPILITDLQLADGEGNWQTWMVDDPPQYRAMQLYAANARGRVLVGGLGRALVCHELVKNPLVEEICVVDRSLDVIDLVGPHLPGEVVTVWADFTDYALGRDQWDSIIVDLWVSSGAADKARLMATEVEPMNALLRDQYPDAHIDFHGFHTVSDTQLASPEMLAHLSFLDPYGQIYGRE